MASAEDVARALSALAAAGGVAAFANAASPSTSMQASTSAQNASLPQYSVPGPGKNSFIIQCVIL